MRLAAVVFVFIVFSAYTLFVMAGHGVTGFLSLAAREPWALQVFIDLLVMLALFSLWIFRDAKERKLPGWPYMILTMVGGSMGALAYLVHREFAAWRSARNPPSTTPTR
jgi:hypothetical protein